jgi:hypothetical protein
MHHHEAEGKEGFIEEAQQFTAGIFGEGFESDRSQLPASARGTYVRALVKR